jgi:hypothetical protein
LTEQVAKEREGFVPHAKTNGAPNKARPEAPALKVWTPEEIWKPLEEPDYVISKLCVRGTLALIVAYGSSLKTWVLADFALSVATGSPWLQRFETKQGRALIIDFESGSYELRRRVHRLARGREYPIPIEAFGFVTMPALSLACDEFYAALRPLAAEYAFIGIDSLPAGSGGLDENDARFATSLNRLKATSEETGCVILPLHHNRKGGAGDGKDTDPREMVRGSSAIFNAVDVVLQMARGKDESFVVRQIKARGGKNVDPFVVRVDDTGPDASVVIASNLPDESADEVTGTIKALDKAKREILFVLAEHKDLRSKDEIYRRIHGTKVDRINALKELMAPERGLVVVSDAGAYRLASEVRQ